MGWGGEKSGLNLSKDEEQRLKKITENGKRVSQVIESKRESEIVWSEWQKMSVEDLDTLDMPDNTRH